MADLTRYLAAGGSNPNKFGHKSYEAASRDGYSNRQILDWVNRNSQYKTDVLYNEMNNLARKNTLDGDINVSYMNILAREADGPGLQQKKRDWERNYIMYNQGGSDSSKAQFAYGELGKGLRSAVPSEGGRKEMARRAYKLFTGRDYDPDNDTDSLEQTVTGIRNSVEARNFNAAMQTYRINYGDVSSINYNRSQYSGFPGDPGALLHWKNIGSKGNRVIPYQQIVINNKGNLEITRSARKLLGAGAKATYDSLLSNMRNSPGGNYSGIMSGINRLDAVGKEDFIDSSKKAVDGYYRDVKIGSPYDPKSGIQPLTGGFDPAYFLENNQNVGQQWNQAQSSVNINGQGFQDLDITARYGNNINTFAAAQFSQLARTDPMTRGNAAVDTDPYSEAYADLTDAEKALYRDELLGLTSVGGSGQRSIDYTDDDTSQFESKVVLNFTGQELLEQDKFGTLTQDSLKFAAAELKKQQQRNSALDLYKNLPGFNEIYSANESLSQSILGDSGIGGYLAMLGQDTDNLSDSLEEQLSRVTGLPSSNSAVYNWQEWFENEMITRYEDLNEITVEFEDTISELDLDSETGRIKYEIELTRMGIDPFDANGNLINQSDALSQLEANNFERTYEIQESFKTNFIENYLRPRFDQSKSMDEFISYMDVQEDEQNIFQTQSALDSLKNLASKQSRLLLQQIQELPGDFDYEFYFNPTEDKYGENQLKTDKYALQKQQVSQDWEDAKANGNSIPRGQSADANGNNYTWNQWAYFYGEDLKDEASFARLHYQVLGAREGFDPARDILTTEDVDDYLTETVLPELDQAGLDLDGATFMNFVTPEQFADELLRGVDPTENKEAWKEILEMYGLDDTAALDEVRGYIIEAVRTGAAKRIRESIKFLNEKNKKITQKELGITYIQRPEDKKDIPDESSSELYKIFQNAGYTGDEEEFFDTFMPDADRSDIEFLQRGISGDFDFKEFTSEDPFEALSEVGGLFGEDNNIFGSDQRTDDDSSESSSNYFNLFEDENEDEDYASDAGRSIIDGYKDFFK
jgi:hypothetical protein